MAPAQADHGGGESFAAGEQPLCRLLDPGRLGRLEPRAEARARATAAANRRQGEIALDRRLRVRAVPGDENLRFAAQHQRRAVELGVGPREFGLELANAPRPDPAADQVKDGGDGREQHQRQDGEAGDIGLRPTPCRTPGAPARRATARRPGRTPAPPQAGKAPRPAAALAARERSNLRVRPPIPERPAPLNPRNESPPREPGGDV